MMTSIEDTSMMLAFPAKSGSSSVAAYPATPLEDLDVLYASTMLGSIEQDTLLLSGLNDSSSSVIGMHNDEFSCLLEHIDKWNSPLEPSFWACNPRFLHQRDMVAGVSSETIQSESLEWEKLQNGSWESRIGACGKEKTSLVSPNVPLKAASSLETKVLRGGAPAIIRSHPKSGLSRPSDSSENSEDEFSLNEKPPVSKNLVSERRRRKKLNERLFSLRALVPKISKMDKASIVSDAIDYVQELQKQMESIQADIQALQSNRDGLQKPTYRMATDNVVPKNQNKNPVVEHRILELEVAQMEEQTYHLRIHCKKGPGVLVQLTKALEALDFEIVSANLTAVNDHILNNVVVKARIGEVVTPEELKKLTLEVVPQFGLVF